MKAIKEYTDDLLTEAEFRMPWGVVVVGTLVSTVLTQAYIHLLLRKGLTIHGIIKKLMGKEKLIDKLLDSCMKMKQGRSEELADYHNRHIKCQITAHAKYIQYLRRSAGKCVQTDNPDKCKARLDKEIQKSEARLGVLRKGSAQGK